MAPKPSNVVLHVDRVHALYPVRRYTITDYPVLSGDSADWLSKHRLKGVGIDTISADAADTLDFAIHKTLFAEDIIIIENLVNLENIGTNLFNFSCFPLSIQEADGSPVRAIAYLDLK